MTGILGNILVATDGSENGDRVVSFAIALARRHRSTLLICNVVDHALEIAESSTADEAFSGISLLQALDDAAQSIVAEAAKRATDRGLLATTAVLDGRAAQAICDCAEERRLDAIVVGTQGKRGFERLFLGSTADGVLRRADIPVFVVPPAWMQDELTLDSLLVAVDESDPSDAAADFARAWAQAEHARLVFCSVLETRDLLGKATTYGFDPTPMLGELRAAATELVAVQVHGSREENISCESVVLEGDPTEEILKTAQTAKAGAIVVGTHGRRGLRRLFVGSVAESVVRRSPIPVVVIRASNLAATSKTAPAPAP